MAQRIDVSPEVALAANLVVAGRIAEAALGRGLEPPQTFRGFLLLAHLSSQAPISQKDLNGAFGGPQNITAPVRLAEEGGWISQHRDPADRRSKELSCTPAGEQILAENLGHLQPAAERLFTGSLPEVVAGLAALVGGFIQGNDGLILPSSVVEGSRR